MTAAVASRLLVRHDARSARYLALLDRRFAALARAARGDLRGITAEGDAERSFARRFLQSIAVEWDDGDENLVRGFLDRWLRPGADAALFAARDLLEGADTLARISSRKSTLAFFLWEMESVLRSLRSRGVHRLRAGSERRRRPKPC
jgi:hypothetical protein